MEGALQLSLDFESKSRSGYRGDFCYLTDSPESGIGKIVSSIDGKVTIEFAAVSSKKTVAEDSPYLKILSDYPSPLRNVGEQGELMDLALTAYELKLTHAFDKLSALSNSRTRLLPHQIESTYIVVNSLRPRFILADEVGLGKTIEAALVMKELIFRRGYKKVLIVTPSPLLVQWQQELKNKFNEDFEIVKRRNFSTDGDKNWKNFQHIITSVDFIKNPKYAEEILKTKWDIVIFDEAHRLRRDYHKITRSYLFAEKISKKCECLLLLTATPFRGKLEELYYLMHLIDPNILGPYHTFVNDYILGNKTDLKDKISKVLLRRRKIEVGGFTKRFAKTVKIELSTVEREFYEETTNYVRREYNLAMRTQNRAIGFVMIVFQKLLDSSVFALISALTKRKFLLENRLHHIQQKECKLEEWDLDETEDVEEFVSGLDESVQLDLQSLKRELLSLNRLILLGKKIKEDKKSIKLKETILKLRKEGHSKFIIFTQFRTTQDFLASVLSDFQVTLFHGSLGADAKENAIVEFKTKTEILICTEAGGEGRNLQFANVLFNYDLPWSPLKIEQRIGRIHRFGQKDNVFIFNFASKDTVAERILEVLTNKIRLFEESIGSSDELLGAIEDELDFNSSFMKFVTGNKSRTEMEEEIDNRIKIAKKGFEKLGALVTPKLIDFNLLDYYNHTLEERSFNNTHLEEFISRFTKIFPEEAGFKLIRKKSQIYEIDSSQYKGKYGTFDSELALQNDSLEFLAFGHLLIDRTVSYLIQNQKGWGVSFHSVSNKEYYVFLVEFQFILNRTELFYFETNPETGSVRQIEGLPAELRKSHSLSKSSASESSHVELPTNLEESLIRTFLVLDEIVEFRKKELGDQTLDLFQKEEFKIRTSNQNTLRQLEEKLMRQEAAFKWEGKPEKKSAMNRTRNEIQKVKEDFDFELRKVRNGKTIQHRFQLFQVYLPNRV
ncbi:DEAD/DEAH box helicase [Leptospira borgpetersenii]|uniref:Type III restriction enzyme, res subunit n=1 Tax=Leptospira borgpetersenii serovar Javanica str. UI 09931 TaxID=1049767 RepID=A0AAV3J9V4_LEPBO|nr:SNF2-related protein [Leptospira borgpetersenii]AXX14387.1 RNA helicase [Leptospira borgpetersenii serovar Ceylonica]EKQ91774.1 type III restriction enzyme, res subunit [Leptospira borgpetersenii str. UI 09149]EMN59185.1 type III restriction enzyme, res subunit [Leptospira borgpetersenii serovar Javanica str. MK146]EPG57290.1 type III restriction enzyme, res subunit [Leptospira borgpetersenii serovar Javanica str. UI 09931]MDQ7242880.1 SNF2-related protein [Leptospira borgpetersenii]